MMRVEVVMNKTLKQLLFWVPRATGILFILFISLFALDVFDMKLGFWETMLALFMHLLPSILLSLAIVIAWKREWFGALLFIGWAIWYITFFQQQHWSAYVLISGLPAVIGLLFLVGWVERKQIRTG